jgi:hypothetical protein
MNNVLLVSSLIMLIIGLIALFGRGALYGSHVRRAQARRRTPTDERVWTRNLTLGGAFLIVIAVLGLIAVFGTQPIA